MNYYSLLLPAIAFFYACASHSVPENNVQEDLAEWYVVADKYNYPAYPLITIGPNINAWSATPKLHDSHTQHMSGTEVSLVGALRVDGNVYRFMGTTMNGENALAEMAVDGFWEGVYVNSDPGSNWMKNDFDTRRWKVALGALGSGNDLDINTRWEDDRQIWVRRTIPGISFPNDSTFLRYKFQGEIDIYINEQKILHKKSEDLHEGEILLPESILASNKGQALIAIYNNSDSPDKYLDFGLYYKDFERTRIFENRAVQKSLTILPTRTTYVFECGPAKLNLSFISPPVIFDNESFRYPINYVTYEIESIDGKERDIEIYFELSPRWTKKANSQICGGSWVETKSGFLAFRGSAGSQLIFDKHGTNTMSGWGNFSLYTRADSIHTGIEKNPEFGRKEFESQGYLDSLAKRNQNAYAMLNMVFPEMVKKAGKILIEYDDDYSARVSEEHIKPYYNRTGEASLYSITIAVDEIFEQVQKELQKIDTVIIAKTNIAGGARYSELCVLACRQFNAFNKLVENYRGEPMLLSANLYDDYSIGSLDYIYYSLPMVLYLNPSLGEAMLNPVFYYCETNRRGHNFPPRNLGMYPIADQPSYPNEGPFNEISSMLTLSAAVTKFNGGKFASKHWEILTAWAEYLLEHVKKSEQIEGSHIVALASYHYMAKVARKKISKEFETLIDNSVSDNDFYTRLEPDCFVWADVIGLPFADSAKYSVVYEGRHNANPDTRQELMYRFYTLDDHDALNEMIRPLLDSYDPVGGKKPDEIFFPETAFIKMLKQQYN